MKNIGRIILSVWLAIALVLSPTLANAEAMTANGWLEQPAQRVGSKSIYKAIQTTAVGTAEGVATTIPTVPQVTKFIAKTGGVFAVTTAIDLLLDGVDYVLDPANNRVRYKPKPIPIPANSPVNPNDYVYPIYSQIYFDPIKACEQHTWSSYGQANYIVTGYQVTTSGLACSFKNVSNNWSNTNGWYLIERRQAEYTLPYDAVAQKILDMANADVGAGDEVGLKQKAMAEAYVGEVADEFTSQAMKEAEWERTKELINEDNQYRPCITISGKIVKVGTLGYRLDRVPPSKPHYPYKGDHYNIYKANQNPNNFQCFWQEIDATDAENGLPPPPNSIPIEPFIR